MSHRRPLRVIVVDGNAICRDGLAQLLHAAADVEVVATAADGAAAVTLSAAIRPDVVLIDLALRGVDAVEATRRMIGARVVVMAAVHDRARIAQALAAGAVGVVLKDAGPDELLDTIRRAARQPRAGEARTPPPAPCCAVS